MGSGGCAALARKGTDISDVHNNMIPECVAHRITIAWVAAIAKGGFFRVSIYLKDSVGMNAESKFICEHGGYCGECGWVWVWCCGHAEDGELG